MNRKDFRPNNSYSSISSKDKTLIVKYKKEKDTSKIHKSTIPKSTRKKHETMIKKGINHKTGEKMSKKEHKKHAISYVKKHGHKKNMNFWETVQYLVSPSKPDKYKATYTYTDMYGKENQTTTMNYRDKKNIPKKLDLEHGVYGKLTKVENIKKE